MASPISLEKTVKSPKTYCHYHDILQQKRLGKQSSKFWKLWNHFLREKSKIVENTTKRNDNEIRIYIY